MITWFRPCRSSQLGPGSYEQAKQKPCVASLPSAAQRRLLAPPPPIGKWSEVVACLKPELENADF